MALTLKSTPAPVTLLLLGYSQLGRSHLAPHCASVGGAGGSMRRFVPIVAVSSILNSSSIKRSRMLRFAQCAEGAVGFRWGRDLATRTAMLGITCAHCTPDTWVHVVRCANFLHAVPISMAPMIVAGGAPGLANPRVAGEEEFEHMILSAWADHGDHTTKSRPR
jgi:hypothetical protein